MRGKRILIVDDQPDIVETIRFRLEAEGFECLTAFDGEEALSLVKREPPDLILLDVMLPKLDGYKICRLLKFDEQYKAIPILMLTARAQSKDKIIGEETGADEYITKPFELDDLLAVVNEYLER